MASIRSLKTTLSNQIVTVVRIITNNLSCDTAVIGAGASGMIAAGFAAKRGQKVTLIERNEKPGRKIMITGKGRCNVTNDCTLDEFMENVPWGAKFLYGAFSRFDSKLVMSFFESLGVPLKVERGRRVFPVSDHACDIVDALRYFIKENGVQLLHGRVKKLLIEDGSARGVVLEDGTVINARNVIVATGGKSYPTTGSTGDGYALAIEAGHKIMPVHPSLVPIETSDHWPRNLMGLSLRNVTLEVYDIKKKKAIYKELGEMLFTHFGITGPLVLSASAHMRDMEALKNGQYKLRIDLKPALSHEQLDKRLQRDLLKYANRDFINSLDDLLPTKLIPIFVGLSGIPGDMKANQITKKERTAAVDLFKCLEMTAACFRPIEEAIVTSGGVSFREINPSTMESKLVKGLFFAGEVIDVDAYTGGYNLQIAFCTGYTAGNSVL